MATTTSFPASDLNNADFSIRKAAVFGRMAAENKALYAIVGLLAIALGVGAYEVHQNTLAIANFKPIVDRVYENGTVDSFYLADFTYHPQPQEVKNMLSDFVTKFYTRKKERLSDYYDSKYYLSQKLGISSYADDQKTEWIKKLLNGQIEECEARVRKTKMLSGLDKAPYEAEVDFDRIYFTPGTDRETRREDVTAVIKFAFADPTDPNVDKKALAKTMAHNALLLTIIDQHADAANYANANRQARPDRAAPTEAPERCDSITGLFGGLRL